MESQNCSACSQVNAAPKHQQRSPGIQLKGTLPFEHLEVDVTEMKVPALSLLTSHSMYLLQLGRGLPHLTEKANQVAHCLI